MKTNTNTNSELQNRPEQLSTKHRGKAILPKIDFVQRREHRRLKTEQLLALLRTQAPRFWEVAEVVGQWVWIQFTEKQPASVTAALAQLGFHWNHQRQLWQHPCGTYPDERATYDPRRKYGSYFPADTKPA